MTGLLVAFQGEAGAYSEEGVRSLFPDAERRPLASIRKVFEAVEVGRCDWGWSRWTTHRREVSTRPTTSF